MNSIHFENHFFIGFLIGALVLVALIFFPILNALVLGVSLVILFHPLYRKLQKVTPRHEGLAALVTVLLAIVIILMPLTFFGYRIFEEARGLYINLASGQSAPFLGLLHEQFQKLMPWARVDINEYTKQILGLFLDNLTLLLSKFANVFFTLFLALFTMYYLLKDAEKIQTVIINVSPLSHAHTTEIISKLRAMESSTIRGTLVVAAVQGILIGIGFFIFGLPSPMVWGMVAIFAALVPILGTSLIFIPGAILLALAGNIIGAIGFIIWGLFIGIIGDNFLKPKLIGHGANVHPLLILFSVIGGLTLFGPMGFLMGPLALSFLLALLDMYPKVILERQS